MPSEVELRIIEIIEPPQRRSFVSRHAETRAGVQKTRSSSVARTGKYGLGFSDAGTIPFNTEQVLTKCNLTRYLPSSAPPDNNPSELPLTDDDAADQIRFISQIENF
jgi:hypothetical protein